MYRQLPNICNHVHKGLRGCTRLKGHDGPHYNVRSKSDLQWTDEEGSYINNQQDWNDHIDRLGK